MSSARDIRDLAELPDRWKSDGAFWSEIPFVWKRWDKFSPDWTHDHCNFCFACICNHRDRFPETDPGERGCYRHAYYAERDSRVWFAALASNGFERNLTGSWLNQ
jgi:hypothetical protein